MKAEELRVGNHIYHKGEVIEVTLVGLFGVQSRTEDDIINASFTTPDLTGIPLSEKHLNYFGFKETMGHFFIEDSGGFFVRCDSGKYSLAHGFYTSKEIVLKTLDYVHELQNAFYEMSKNELKMKEA